MLGQNYNNQKNKEEIVNSPFLPIMLLHFMGLKSSVKRWVFDPFCLRFTSLKTFDRPLSFDFLPMPL